MVCRVPRPFEDQLHNLLFALRPLKACKDGFFCADLNHPLHALTFDLLIQFKLLTQFL